MDTNLTAAMDVEEVTVHEKAVRAVYFDANDVIVDIEPIDAGARGRKIKRLSGLLHDQHSVITVQIAGSAEEVAEIKLAIDAKLDKKYEGRKHADVEKDGGYSYTVRLDELPGKVAYMFDRLGGVPFETIGNVFLEVACNPNWHSPSIEVFANCPYPCLVVDCYGVRRCYNQSTRNCC